VLLLNALSPGGSAVDITALVLEAFHTLRSFGAAHRARRTDVFVAQNLGGNFALESDPGERAALGAVAGLAKSAAREWPLAHVRIIDLPADAAPVDLAASLLGELAGAEAQLEVGLQAGRRIAPRLVPATRRLSARALAPGEVWVVSGGARGVTAACLQALVRRVPLKLALLGRTSIDDPEPSVAQGRATDAELKRAILEDAKARAVKLIPAQVQRQVSGILAAREARMACEALRALGAEVRYFPVDITNAEGIRRVVRDVRAHWGPIRGIVHAAGVLADKALHEKTDEQFLSVYRTKVEGFLALLAVTRDDPLTTIACFSSVAARVGNAGQADYAAANEALNKLCQAEHHRRPDCLVRAINWGPWDGGMVSPGLKAHFAAMGVRLIPLEAGAEVFADLMTGCLHTTVECVVGGTTFAKSGDTHVARGSGGEQT
jgi:NAD(P)-dependent dehydrogenase (short-subunit alcohol dehydrogenase family)